MPNGFSRLAGRVVDRLILSPSRHEIAAADRVLLRVPHVTGELELWLRRGDGAADAHAPAVLAFPGTGSRAEDSDSLITAAWPSADVDVWWVNPPGYGGSTGVARLHNVVGMAESALVAVRETIGDRPIIAEGYSLGTVAALYLAATGQVDGILLRNPPALSQLLHYRAGWWSLGLISTLLSLGLPRTIDSIRNAARSAVPALFVIAMKDRVVPASIQYRVVDAYAGPRRVVTQPEGDHATPLSDSELQRLRAETDWLRESIRTGSSNTEALGDA